MKKYWLMKSEPDAFSIDQLENEGTSLWEGVRNYQARNFMLKEMQVGDEVLFYHSSAEPSGFAGLAYVAAKAIPDPTQFNKKSKYFDAKATKENPRWFCVKVGFRKKFKNFLSLAEIKNVSALQKMLVLKKGQRLSIQPVTATEFETIKKLGE